MAEIVNLRRVRKRLALVEAEQDAAGNRARFGRTRGERERDELEADRAGRAVDNARLDQEPEDANRAKDRATTS